MKRFFLFVCSAFIAMVLYAQSSCLEYYEKPSFLGSKYNNCHKNVVLKARGYADITIDSTTPLIKRVNGKTKTATFEARVDSDSVYDCSYKIYAAQFGNCKIEYVTYGLADKLSFVLNDKEYTLSCLDGGMDVHIKHLSHQYTPLKRGERLEIKVTDNLPLRAKDKSEILLRKGSTLCFDVTDSSE